MKIRGKLYRTFMQVAHKYNWHYAPPIYPDGDTQLWCKWCGFRETIYRNGKINPNSLSQVLVNDMKKRMDTLDTTSKGEKV